MISDSMALLGSRHLPPLGAPVGEGVQISLWLHGFPQGKRKLPVAV